MGDKSPRSKQKDKDQKQDKADTSRKEKQRAIAGKQQAGMTAPKKKK